MSLFDTDAGRVRATQTQIPQVRIFLQPIASPAALGLAGFAGSTFIVASWIAGWWGTPDSPTTFFPFVAFWGGLAQFLAGLRGSEARDVLVNVLNTMWGAFWLSIGLLYLLVAVGSVPPTSIYEQNASLAAWFVVLAVTTWSCAIAACGRDVIIAALTISLATGTTIACCLFHPGVDSSSRKAGIKAAAYFWLLAALLAWWRVTVYLVEEAYGADSPITRFFPIFRTGLEKRAPLVQAGLGEPGVKRGVPKPLTEGQLSEKAELAMDSGPANGNGTTSSHV